MSAPNTEFIPQPVTKKDGFNYSALAARILIFTLLACSLGLIWWSYYRGFYPYLKQSRELTLTVSKLNGDLSDLSHKWTTGEITAMDNKTSMLQTNFFTDQNELQSWLADLREQSLPLGMDVKSEFASPVEQTDAPPRFLIIPTTVTVQFPPDRGVAKGPSPYQKLLQLSQTITTREKTDCLNELTVESGPNSIDRAVISFHFWTGTNDSK
jgi:hypothetical protein